MCIVNNYTWMWKPCNQKYKARCIQNWILLSLQCWAEYHCRFSWMKRMKDVWRVKIIFKLKGLFLAKSLKSNPHSAFYHRPTYTHGAILWKLGLIAVSLLYFELCFFVPSWLTVEQIDFFFVMKVYWDCSWKTCYDHSIKGEWILPTRSNLD